jgi:hypothetical protein
MEKEENNKEIKILTDVLGIKPVADSFNLAFSKSIELIETFLALTCKPLLQEIGLLAKDKVQYWRLKNMLGIIEKTRGKLMVHDELEKLIINPRVALEIAQNGSLIEDDEVQELWAGLLASSSSENGENDENLIFVNILKQLTNTQVRILKYSCENSKKIKTHQGLILSENDFDVNLEKLSEVSGIKDIHRMDRELDYLSAAGLISTGFMRDKNPPIADIAPSALALNLYVRCQGFKGSALDYWANEITMEKSKFLNDKGELM